MDFLWAKFQSLQLTKESYCNVKLKCLDTGQHTVLQTILLVDFNFNLNMFKLRKNFFFQYTETMGNRKTRPAIIHAEFVIIDFCSWNN